MKFSWGHGIIVFFVIFFIWIISFVIFSLKQNNDLVTKDYYKQGAEYSNQMAIDERSAIYTDSVLIKNIDTDVLVCLGSEISEIGLDKELFFYRPSGKKDDLHIKIDEHSDSIYISKSQLLKGRYQIKLSWKLKGINYQIVKEFNVK